ncbi:MAG: hypothetical protein HW397_201 [Dehalococcoidia bacterium]|nr:hypothetical protein [Dehalococcoidia bacterium]
MSSDTHAMPHGPVSPAHGHEHVVSGVDPETGHVHPHVVTKPREEVTRDILAATQRIGSTYKLALLITGALLILGIVGFAWQASSKGFDNFSPWAYLMASYAFLLATASTAPMVSIGQRMLRSHWRRPLTRASEMFAVVGILSTLMFIPLLSLLPPTGHMVPAEEAGPCVAALQSMAKTGECLIIDRVSIWWGFPTTPFLPDILAVIALAVLGLLFLIVSAWPDLAAYRPMATGFRRSMLDLMLFRRWVGSDHQWAVHKALIMALGAMYFFLLVFVHSIVISDFGMALVPKWVDSIMPATATVNGFQAGLASVIIAMYFLHRFGGYRDYIGVEQFWAASKLLLAFSIFWFYFWFSGFIIYWYGRQPGEQGVLGTLMFQSYRTPFVLAFLCCFLLPLVMLIWNGLRKSMLGPTVVSFVILFGVMFDKIRIYVASFQTADLQRAALSTTHPDPIAIADLPNPLIPGAADIMIVLGAIGGAIFLYLVAMKIIPVMSIWHLQEGMLYRRIVPYLKTHILLMGKPD